VKRGCVADKLVEQARFVSKVAVQGGRGHFRGGTDGLFMGCPAVATDLTPSIAVI